MSTTRTPGPVLSTLTLVVEVLDDNPDWPDLTILVDGRDPFAGVAAGWRGFDPGSILGSRSALLPRGSKGRRVAICRCSCGEPGCGVIAPIIALTPDGRRISWIDFRDYTGVFADPVSEEVSGYDGRPWALPDIHFDAGQYAAEVRRASRDRSWETVRRRTARLVEERLAPLRLTLPPDLRLGWVTPAWAGDGVLLVFERGDRRERPSVQQQVLRLSSRETSPDEAAADIVDQVLSTPPKEWVATFAVTET